MYSPEALFRSDWLQTFDIHFDNELAHDYYGDGKKLAEKYET